MAATAAEAAATTKTEREREMEKIQMPIRIIEMFRVLCETDVPADYMCCWIKRGEFEVLAASIGKNKQQSRSVPVVTATGTGHGG